ncbi:MAG: transcriptional regulator [Vampirovibrio sp.]|nr:transcriptional regulator [Vampirovibrio sp.]
MTLSETMKFEKPKAKDRILDAAAKVFAEQGIKGATTREIAKLADVNETTLFRNFQSKELLLKAVVEKASAEITEALVGPGMSNHNLHKDLLYYAEAYSKVLAKNEPMVRMFIGEAYRQKEEASLIAVSAWKPVRDKLIAYLEDAKANGQVRSDLDTIQAIDMLKGILLAHMLRKGHGTIEYSTDSYLQTVLEIFIRGIVPPPATR